MKRIHVVGLLWAAPDGRTPPDLAEAEKRLAWAVELDPTNNRYTAALYNPDQGWRQREYHYKPAAFFNILCGIDGAIFGPGSR